MNAPRQSWKPTLIKRFNKAFATSADTAQVTTDLGNGYLKALGNREGPNILACEYVATSLAKWFGLSTFDFALIQITEQEDIPHHDWDPKNRRRGDCAEPGPAFITKEERGQTWSGNPSQLEKLSNPEDMSRIVVFDTWTLNCDRYSFNDKGALRKNLNNVYLSESAAKGQLLLKAMDHTHCFSCGHSLTKKIAQIDHIRDKRIFGLFPEFRAFLDREQVRKSAAKLRLIDVKEVRDIIQNVPAEWEITLPMREALLKLIVERADFVADTIENGLFEQQEFGFLREHSEE